MAMKNWLTRRANSTSNNPDGKEGGVLIHALDGFLGAGSAARIAAQYMRSGYGEVQYEFDIDSMFDYRARRPSITFHQDHYSNFEFPELQIALEYDAESRPFYLLSGPEPDFQWEVFASEVREFIEEYKIDLVLGIGAVPMGVPHTRPPLITAHGNRPALVDRQNIWEAQVTVPASAQALLEYRLGEWGHDAAGYVVHVPHYLAQIDYPTASLALLDAVMDRTGLKFDVEPLRVRQMESVREIEEQIAEQGGASVLSGLEEQYDAFTRGAAQSLLASETDLPSGEELANQFEQFLARQRKDEQG
jgi:hypothetical protein